MGGAWVSARSWRVARARDRWRLTPVSFSSLSLPQQAMAVSRTETARMSTRAASHCRILHNIRRSGGISHQSNFERLTWQQMFRLWVSAAKSAAAQSRGLFRVGSVVAQSTRARVASTSTILHAQAVSDRYFFFKIVFFSFASSYTVVCFFLG